MTAERQPEPCRCALCLALLNLAASAERNYQAANTAERAARGVPAKRRRKA